MTQLTGEELGLLRKVPFLASLDEETLQELRERGRLARWRARARIVGELESGSEIFVVLRGEAEVSIEGQRGGREVLGRAGPGSAFGEMSSLTGELRSASVFALTDVEGLVIPDLVFDDVRERYPQVAVALVRTMAERLAAAESTIESFLDPSAAAASADVAPAARELKGVRRGSISRAWRELVVGRKKDLAFLTFAAFVGTLLVVRFGVYVSFRVDFAPMDVLRAAYTSGFALLGVSACTALLTFRPALRRAVAIAYGVAVALILNELGVTLAFDIFYKDIHTPDPHVPFDVEELYRRTEGIRAILIALAILLQAAYLRPFWRRAAFVARTRMRRLVSRR